MSWAEELLNLYERNSEIAGQIQYKEYKHNGKIERIPYVLLPPFHTTVTAQLEVIIDSDGNFLSASIVAEDDKMTIIPVTEKSGSRTAGKAPHPLCDNLQYLTGYGSEESYDLYICALEQWHLSNYTHKKVDAVYYYLKKRCLFEDLVSSKILVLDGDGKLDENVKIQNIPQEKVFIRFVIRQKLTDYILEETCWKDQTLHQAFIDYYSFMNQKKELDYLTGRMEYPTYLHSKKIRNEGDGAKLISSNDSTNFTFRGRFVSKEEAFSIGSETSQKIHNALKWIIRKQGHSFDTLEMVSWETSMARLPEWDEDTEKISSMDKTEEETSAEDDWGEDEYTEIEESNERNIVSDENMVTAKQLYQAMVGYKRQVDFTSRMLLMAFDAATSGRVSMIEYKQLEATRYLENIQNWHEHGGWIQEKFKNGRRIQYYGIPGIKEIADILYGTESGDADTVKTLRIRDKNGKRLYAEISRRLLPCIWDKRNIHYDLVQIAVNKASSPQSYAKRYNWERVLSLACSFVKKHRYEIYKEDWNVALNTNCTDRNYLYGRLLAVADRIEYRTFDKEGDGGRITNAKRYMSVFARRPFETWQLIEESIQPYLNKLNVNERKYYENIIDSICQLFEVDSFMDNDPLDGRYLLGFHSQSFEFKNYKTKEMEEA
ncbi:MAG: type I-C CRISPR-associated protein Cas8c/Csd1 [Eubacteriales bacterium]|nr:type I-C CRISPR-associated protein Cas8c/Csd1 [Eubacteriales bacterium]